jgi:hypothetical protein
MWGRVDAGMAARKIYMEGITTIHLGREICCSISVGTFYWGIEAFVRLLKFVSRHARCAPWLDKASHPGGSYVGNTHENRKFHLIVVQVASVTTYDGAIVDAETIRLCLGWGCSLAVGPYR